MQVRTAMSLKLLGSHLAVLVFVTVLLKSHVLGATLGHYPKQVCANSYMMQTQVMKLLVCFLHATNLNLCLENQDLNPQLRPGNVNLLSRARFLPMV